MPAITSPLMALRLSGRLMVIQYACPRFSRITQSVIAVLAFSACFSGKFALGSQTRARTISDLALIACTLNVPMWRATFRCSLPPETASWQEDAGRASRPGYFRD
jgi:hypothetical protein